VAARLYAFAATPRGTIRVGPLDDCRSVAVSPDGQWLATGNRQVGGVRIWRVVDGTEAFKLPIEGGSWVDFSPDGKWLVAGQPHARLWKVGTWQEEKRIKDDMSGDFSPDGRLTVLVDQSRILRLVELATGRTLARLESPDLGGVQGLTFSPDGSRLVVTTNDVMAAHVWNLRLIRRRLAEMGLDWDAPAYSDDDPADPSAPPLPELKIDYGGVPVQAGQRF
jgi:WD40 repeat protein